MADYSEPMLCLHTHTIEESAKSARETTTCIILQAGFVVSETASCIPNSIYILPVTVLFLLHHLEDH